MAYAHARKTMLINPISIKLCPSSWKSLFSHSQGNRPKKRFKKEDLVQNAVFSLNNWLTANRELTRSSRTRVFLVHLAQKVLLKRTKMKEGRLREEKSDNCKFFNYSKNDKSEARASKVFNILERINHTNLTAQSKICVYRRGLKSPRNDLIISFIYF